MDVVQTGQEIDFILVSCIGSRIEPTRREQVLKAKRVCSFFCSFSTYHINFFFYTYHIFVSVSSINYSCWNFLGQTRFIEKIWAWIHNHSSWSPNGKNFSLISDLWTFSLEYTCLLIYSDPFLYFNLCPYLHWYICN